MKHLVIVSKHVIAVNVSCLDKDSHSKYIVTKNTTKMKKINLGQVVETVHT